MIYLQIALEFFKTGMFAVGGGLATLPFLREIAMNHSDWYTLSDLSDMIAVGNAIPGPIGVNMATYAGHSAAGIPGGIIAPLSMVFPSFVVILIVSAIFDKFRNSKFVEGAFVGLRPAVVALISVALLQLAKEVFIIPDVPVLLQSFSIKHIILFVAMFIFSCFKKKTNIVYYIIAGAIIGILFQM